MTSEGSCPTLTSTGMPERRTMALSSIALSVCGSVAKAFLIFRKRDRHGLRVVTGHSRQWLMHFYIAFAVWFNGDLHRFIDDLHSGALWHLG
ncbi:Uncharacterised protein [Serratia fonticola]|uniref:Uncharacterized protein n=1 Tax=Serratia fonticola TaxID=47917 RepID=A0A4U9V3I3_SERFO|nr:Uncharacterised protein [Serratia fonticola]